MINKRSLMHISKDREVLIQEEDFVYLRPCYKLISMISNFTITFPNSMIIADEYTIMPHGCVTLVLFYYNNNLHSFLFGPTTKLVKVGNIANKCNIIFIIEFQPAGFFSFEKINQNELMDKIIPFSLIDNTLDKAIKKIFQSASSVDQLLFEIEEKLYSSILFQKPKEVTIAINEIIKTKGIISSTKISTKVSYCPRHLNRLFKLYIGMTMKSFCQLVRINKSFLLLNDQTNTLAAVSEKLGYYDVSHFVKDFKSVCNMTPHEYKANMSDFYSEIAKF